MAITRAYGSLEQFKKKFTNAAITLFGSGWAWLAKNPDGSPAIEVTSNAGSPLREGKKPLLTCDVWEHAYYIDYRNARAKYIEALVTVFMSKFLKDIVFAIPETQSCMVDPEPENTAAIRAYEKVGFKHSHTVWDAKYGVYAYIMFLRRDNIRTPSDANGV